MSVHDDEKTKIYKLDNKRFAILHPHAILTDLAQAQAEAISVQLSEGTVTMEEMEHYDYCIPLHAIESVQTNLTKFDDTLLLTYTKAGSSTPEKVKMEFASDEKDAFVQHLYSYMKEDYTYEQSTNTAWASMKPSIVFFLYTLLIGGFLSWLAYYMETADEYSFRVPAILYPVVELISYTGYMPVAIFMGVIVLISLMMVVKRAIKPSTKLVIKRKSQSQAA
ncbi:hypothetical protein NS115_01800 [Paenibacillus jamilae]|uniref:Uncharacterized protein n=1 Tax=Paenibacillus jamilae TaxID=114136 RepID=A0ACC5A0N2_9BACL|nr:MULTISPECIES: hypothetical protein [Paenibacillus]AUO07703.1 hypothetical protein C0638_14770 [Paenibacillus sp. lzh-N1]KTS84884.1 hypothetical protein NS115_01800 [Paenibacillus jamilae]